VDLGLFVFYLVVAIPVIWLMIRIGQRLVRYGEWMFNATLESLPLDEKASRARSEITMNALTIFGALMAFSIWTGPLWDILWFPTSVAGFVHTTVCMGIRKKYNLERGLIDARKALKTESADALPPQ
jgi:hypothetical protein